MDEDGADTLVDSGPVSNEGRTLRPKDKRKAPAFLNDSVTYFDDEWQPTGPGSLSSTPKRSNKKDNTKKDAKDDPRRRSGKGSTRAAGTSSTPKVKRRPTTRASASSPPPSPPSFSDSEDDNSALVIDDPDATYEERYDSDEEKKRKSRRNSYLLSSPFLMSSPNLLLDSGLEPIEDEEMDNINLDGEEQPAGKKKKRKPAVDTTGQVKKYQVLPSDEKGNPILPIVLRGLTVESLGHVVHERKKFHAKRYIWPVGFRSRRMYSSMTTLNARCEYTSEITDGDDEPRFVVTCLENPAAPVVIEATTSSGAWAEVGKRVNDLKEEYSGRRVFTQLSGPEMFGFSHPTISKLIQDLPNAHLCDKYEFQKFEPSTVAYVPSRGEKNDDEDRPTRTRSKRARPASRRKNQETVVAEEEESDNENDSEDDDSVAEEYGSDFDEEEAERKKDKRDRSDKKRKRKQEQREEAGGADTAGTTKHTSASAPAPAPAPPVATPPAVPPPMPAVQLPVEEVWEEEEEEEAGSVV
eukprot:TRINITY_DN4394_c0_g1_i2.p1 TRINITY_DN4394_c0_g1~~TRINITY_DN4394_c0_g1_i2.p1  ORF type:complete len:523 (+),score=153.67 TRINITY_DN4394_c0_g1_i2:158-1726(+)